MTDLSPLATASEPVLIIAEAGVNHNGDMQMAMRLVEEAARAGADVVKFQTFTASRLVTAQAPTADYQRRTTDHASQLEMLRRLELSEAQHATLMDHCRSCGIRFLSTPFGMEEAEMLAALGMDLWKIPSGEITNLPLLRKIGSLRSHVLLSTGMSTLGEVDDALRVLEQAGTPRSAVTLLHCTTQYPAPPASVNLRAMLTLGALGCKAVGYSDHTAGITVPVAAAALGAKVIEKHFTLDRSLPGPDHMASLEPGELAQMVQQVRTVEQALGSPRKAPAEAELPNIAVARRSIVAARHIAPGEPFTPQNLTVKRPGTGLSPMLWDTLMGRPAPRAYRPDEQI